MMAHARHAASSDVQDRETLLPPSVGGLMRRLKSIAAQHGDQDGEGGPSALGTGARGDRCRHPRMSTTVDRSNQQEHLPSAAEEAGAAACRAGVPRNAVPSLCACESSGRVLGMDCRELVQSWCRGWDLTNRLQAVTQRMFPGSALGPAMSEVEPAYRYVGSS
jgi:hypothetical protein